MEKIINVYEDIEKRHNIYVECSAGWGELINDLDKELREISPSYKVVQIKEKFGELRYYIDFDRHYSELSKKIDKAIEKSHHICEICGREGSIDYDQSWLMCRCPKHGGKEL